MSALEQVADDAVASWKAPTDSRAPWALRDAWQSLHVLARLLLVVVLDVWGGVLWVVHHAFAAVGLLAVAAAVFLAGRVDVRDHLEAQALEWLTQRADSRQESDGGADDANETLLAMAEPDAVQRATAANPAELSRQQAAVAFWIARRYNVAPEPISRLVEESWAIGKRTGMEPTLMLAVMAVESGFNPFAQSHVGAQGLMQVMTRVHHDKYDIFGGQNAAFDPVTNLRVGAQVLQDCIRHAGGLSAGLKCYVGAANLSDDGGYAAKVLAEETYLKQVAAGRKVAVNASLPSAAAAVEVSHPDAANAAKAAGSAPAVLGHVDVQAVSVASPPPAPGVQQVAWLDAKAR